MELNSEINANKGYWIKADKDGIVKLIVMINYNIVIYENILRI